MCYCCRKLEFGDLESEFGLSHGLSHGLSLSDPVPSHLIGLESTASHTASQFGLSRTRPPNISHVICLSQSERSCTLAHGGRPWESEVRGHGSPRCQSDSSGRGSPILGPIRLPHLVDWTPTASLGQIT